MRERVSRLVAHVTLVSLFIQKPAMNDDRQVRAREIMCGNTTDNMLIQMQLVVARRTLCPIHSQFERTSPFPSFYLPQNHTP